MDGGAASDDLVAPPLQMAALQPTAMSPADLPEAAAAHPTVAGLRGASGLDASDRGMFARFVAAGEAGAFIWPGVDERRLDPNSRKRLQLQRTRREINVQKITQFDVQARASFVQSGARGRNHAVSTIPTIPAVRHGLAAVPTQHGAGAPRSRVYYSVQTLSLGAPGARSRHDLRSTSQNGVLWRASKFSGPLQHLVEPPSPCGRACEDSVVGTSQVARVVPTSAQASQYVPGARGGSAHAAVLAAQHPPQRRPMSAFPSRSLTRYPRPQSAHARVVGGGRHFDPTGSEIPPFPVGVVHSGFDPSRSLQRPHFASPDSDAISPPYPQTAAHAPTGSQEEVAPAAAPCPSSALAGAMDMAEQGDEPFLAFLRERKAQAREALSRQAADSDEDELPHPARL